MICHKCKTDNDSNATYCRSCGFKLQHTSKLKFGLFVLCPIIITLAIIAFVFINNNDNGDFEAIGQETNDYVDLGLSVKWSKYNLGANSVTAFGKYFGFKYKYPVNSSTIIYVSQTESTIPGYYIKEKLESYSSIGRLPNKEEWQELIGRCQWIWENENGTNGYRIIGPSGNCIFLPAAGLFINDPMDCETGLSSQNERGIYLSDCIWYDQSDKSIKGDCLKFWNNGIQFDFEGGHYLTDYYHSIRLVK